ncbi:hypothetical protein HK096_001478, partial [Nowakowskiella sp. JEL0078]
MTAEELFELKGGKRTPTIENKRPSYNRTIDSHSESTSPKFSSFTTPMVKIPEIRMSSITVPLSLPESPSQINPSKFGNLNPQIHRGWVDLGESNEITEKLSTQAWSREFKNPTLDAALETNTDISIRRKINLESNFLKESPFRTGSVNSDIIIQDGYTEPFVFNEKSTSKHSLKSNNINLVFFPTRKNYLGEGRYAQVFKAQFTIRELKLEDNLLVDSDSVFSFNNANTAKERDFQTCAVKRTHDTPDAQSQGVSELQILQKVSPLCDNIIALIGAKDENENDIPPGKKVQKRLSVGLGLSVTSEIQQQKKSVSRSRLLIILEYASNGNMWEWIKSHPETMGRQLWLRWAKQLACAVKCMHSTGIVHHDIKPHNCLLSEMLDVKLADFGNASSVPEDDLTDEEGHTSANEEKLKDSYFTSKPTISSVSITPTISSTSNNLNFLHLNNESIQSVQSQSKRINVTTNTLMNIPSQCNTPEPPSPSSPSGTSVRSMQSSSSTRSLLVRDGIGRGTEAYTAPELFATSSNSEYSFPVDMYSVGVTLYTLITGVEPFSRAKSSVHMMLGISKGFFESGLQTGIGTAGPDLDDYKTMAEEARSAKFNHVPFTENDDGVSRSGLLSTSQSSSISLPPLLRPSTPSFQQTASVLKHLNGEPVDRETVSLLKRLLSKDPASRPTSSDL